MFVPDLLMRPREGEKTIAGDAQPNCIIICKYLASSPLNDVYMLPYDDHMADR
jgi:hypothetical protein